MSVKMAIEYLESFIECDMGKDHHCSECGTNSCNQVDHREIEKALKELTVWIDPKVSLPPLGELVIVRKLPTGNVVAFDNITDHGGWLNNSYHNDHTKHDVMCWMRIPENNFILK